MSFTGDLEHLPIVDVIQLLHSARKSGVLSVRGRKGESQLVFKEGYIVSANHLNGKVRIGKILVGIGAITPEGLERGLRLQNEAGRERMPLIVTLVEQGLVKEEDAYRGLEQLIEMTVVEILTWRGGTFTLELLPKQVGDDYRYYPERIGREINIDTQGVLMDALRIFDEKMRDGELAEEDGTDGEEALISADDLGLADLDRLETKVPATFAGLDEVDHSALHRQKVAEAAPWLSAAGRDELAAFLGGPADVTGENPPRAVILFTCDRLMAYAATAACIPSGFAVHAVSRAEELEPLLDRDRAGESAPLLVFDAPVDCGELSPEQLVSLRRLCREKHPGLRTVQLAVPDDAPFTLEAYRDGVRAVIPKPSRENVGGAFAADTIRFLKALRCCLEGLAAERDRSSLGRLAAGIGRLHGVAEPAEVAGVLRGLVADMCGRALTLAVREGELVAGQGVGIARGGKLGLRIPLDGPSLFRTVIETGRIHCGPTGDEAVREHLFAAIGAPLRPAVLLLPVKNRGKTVALTYGDFGDGEAAPLEIDQLELLARHAELVLENALYRKRLAIAR